MSMLQLLAYNMIMPTQVHHRSVYGFQAVCGPCCITWISMKNVVTVLAWQTEMHRELKLQKPLPEGFIKNRNNK